MNWEPVTIGEALRRSAQKHPDRVCLVGPEERLTFAEFDGRVDRLAEGLLSIGVEHRDHVAIWMANDPRWVMTWMACARIGAVLIPVNTRFKTQEAAYILRQSDAKVLVSMDRYWDIDFLGMIREMVPDLMQSQGQIKTPDLPALRAVVHWGDGSLPGFLSLAELTEGTTDGSRLGEAEKRVRPDDTAIIVYTSGTTGDPKGAMHSHVVLRNSANVARVMHIDSGDVILGHMPFYHVAGAFTALLPTMLLGCTLVTMPQWVAEEALALIEREKINVFGGIPTHFVDMLDVLERRQFDTSSLKSAWIGGAPVTPDVANSALDKLSLDALQCVYGMTETTAATVFSEFEAPMDIVCDNKGKPIGEFEVEVVDPSSGQALPPGQVGEVRVRGHIVMQGYYKNPEATKEVITDDGWFMTGDLGIFDEAGYLKITGRVKDMFIVGGSNAYPAEIERMLQSHDGVKQAVVVGVPHRRLGEVGYAFVEPAEGAAPTDQEIIAFCRANLADYKVPRHVEFVKEFPLTPTGKIQRFVLSEMAKEHLEQLASGR